MVAECVKGYPHMGGAATIQRAVPLSWCLCDVSSNTGVILHYLKEHSKNRSTVRGNQHTKVCFVCTWIFRASSFSPSPFPVSNFSSYSKATPISFVATAQPKFRKKFPIYEGKTNKIASIHSVHCGEIWSFVFSSNARLKSYKRQRLNTFGYVRTSRVIYRAMTTTEEHVWVPQLSDNSFWTQGLSDIEWSCIIVKRKVMLLTVIHSFSRFSLPTFTQQRLPKFIVYVLALPRSYTVTCWNMPKPIHHHCGTKKISFNEPKFQIYFKTSQKRVTMKLFVMKWKCALLGSHTDLISFPFTLEILIFLDLGQVLVIWKCW